MVSILVPFALSPSTLLRTGLSKGEGSVFQQLARGGRSPFSKPAGQPQKKCGGFTLIEMMVTLGILAILLGLVTLNAPSFLATFRLSSGARQVATDLQLVRMKAIAQNRKFRALFTAGSTTYEVQRRNDADTGWDFHALYGHGTTAGAAQPISLPQGVQINSVPADGDVIFQPRGTGENATIVVKHSVLSTTKSVVVNMAGRVRIQ